MSLYLSPEIPLEARTWRNDEKIWRWCRQYTSIDPSAHQRWLEKISSDPSIKMFGIYEAEFGLGVCGLTSIDHVNQKAEFSCYVAPKYQGKGVGKRAMRCLLKHGFQDFNLNRIWGETYFNNPALKMFQDLGMKIEGRQRQAYFRNGQFIDAILVSILRSEFV